MTASALLRLRARMPVTVRVRGALTAAQLRTLEAQTAEAVARALRGANAQAWRSGLRLTVAPDCPTSLERGPAAGPGSGGTGPTAAVEAAARRGAEASAAKIAAGLDPARADGSHAGPGRADGEGPGAAADPPALAIFDSHATVYAYATAYYEQSDLLPRGNLRTGMYGIWEPDMRPHLFWATGQVTEGAETGQLVWESMPFAHGELDRDGNFQLVAGGRQPADVQLGRRYRLSVPAAPPPVRRRGRQGRRPADALMRLEGGGTARRAYLNERSLRLLRGLEVRFTAALTELIEVTGTVPARTDLPSPDELKRRAVFWSNLYGPKALPAEPPQGEPDWLWEWFGTLNVQPAEVRANMLVRQVFTLWEQQGRREHLKDPYMLLLSQIWRERFYKEFCRLLAIDMLNTSRARMIQFKAAMAQPEWKHRFLETVSGLSGLAKVANDARLEAERRWDAYAAVVTQQYGGTRERIVFTEQEEARRNEASIQAHEARKHEQDMAAILDAAAEREPLLALLTIREGRTVGTLGAAILAVMQHRDPDRLAELVSRGLDYLLGKIGEGLADIGRPGSDAYKLLIVQQEASRQLAAWCEFDPMVKRAIDNLLSQGIVEWLGLGVLLVVLSFAFPPLGLALSAVVSTYAATSSVVEAARLHRLSRVRLAQYSFQPLVSDEEVNAAITRAVVDVLFAGVDVGAAAHGAYTGLRRAVAQRAAASLSLSLEPLAARLGKLAEWPLDLRLAVRARLLGELRGLPEGARVAEELLEPVQRELAALYETHLTDLGERFGAALESRTLANDPEAIRAWLAAEELSPDAFVRGRLAEELAPGRPLYDRTVGRRLAGRAALPGPAAVLPDVEQLAAIERQLGDLAGTLRPNRLLALQRAAGLTHLPVANLADQLGAILRRVPAPEETLARLERLLEGRRDAEAVLGALGRSASPRPALEALTPELLDAATPAGVADLVDALARGGPRPGEQMARIVSDLHPADGSRRIFREVVQADGRRAVESWDGASGIWRPEPSVRLRPGPAPAAPPPAPVGEEARAAARARLEQQTAARIRRGRGRLTRQAERLQRAQAAIAARPEGERILAEIVDAAARDGAEVATDILEGLASLPQGPLAAELEAVAGYLRGGHDARALASIVSRATTQPGLRGYLRGFLARLPTLTDQQLRGLQIVVAERGLGRPGGQAALYLVNGFGEHTGQVLTSLAELAPRSENLRYLIGYLASPAENLRIAGLGHLLAARGLLSEFGDARLAFEASGVGARRVIDVQVITAHTGARLLDVEIKEVTILRWATNARAQSEMARDIVRSTRLAQAGEAPLERIRWLVRRDELTLEFGTEAKVQEALKARLLGVFDSDLVRNGLSAAELQAAMRDFIDHFDRIVRLF